jgi:quaternary ammonium compound-resistance protein SugE
MSTNDVDQCLLFSARKITMFWSNPWFNLFVAGLFEVAWALGLKYTKGWTKLGPSVATVVLMIASFYFLARAVQKLPIGTSYAIWTGIGAVGTALLGMTVFKEPVSTARLVCIGVIVAGIVGLKLTSP